MSTRSSGRSRRPYHHGDLRAVLVRAAADLLEEQGAVVLSLRETARRAGVSHAAPYRHFKDRESLLAAVAADGFALLARSLGAGLRPGASEMGEAYVRFALEHPQRFRLMFGGLLSLGAYPELSEHAGRAFDALSGAYAALGGEREARIAAAAAWSLVHGLSHLLLDGHFITATQGGKETARFIRDVIGASRFSLGAQRSA